MHLRSLGLALAGLGLLLLAAAGTTLLTDGEPPAAPSEATAPGTVRGRVVDAWGHPAAGVLAVLDANGPVATTPVDVQGRFTLSAPPGDYLLHAARPTPQGQVYGPPRLITLTSEDIDSMDLPLPAKSVVGVGVTVALRGRDLVVAELHPTSRVARAGVQPGDLLLAIDGENLDSTSVVHAQLALQGPPDSPTVLLVQRAGEAPHAVELRR